jgi:hypothetical protein
VSERTRVGRAAGLSAHKLKVAMGVASIPHDLFEALIERQGRPPTVTELAAVGRRFARGANALSAVLDGARDAHRARFEVQPEEVAMLVAMSAADGVSIAEVLRTLIQQAYTNRLER